MIVFLYNIFIRLYGAGISVASLFNEKAGLWKKGRKNILHRIRTAVEGSSPVIWMHCASLGEFEQGRPVLEQLRKQYPGNRLLLTFFSPSGYEIRKNYNGADWVFYLPLDTPGNMERFVEAVQPSLVIFVKYEYWYHALHELSKRQIPAILISAIFKADSVFFKWYGTLHRKMLAFFNHIFVQDAESKNRLSQMMEAAKITVAGDTRFDRVAEIVDSFEPIEAVEHFVGTNRLLVAGSTWPDDEKMLAKLVEKENANSSLIIAPHEITESHIKFLLSLFPGALLFSDLKENDTSEDETNSNILIINNIGMLSSLYYYADICYIGGGFNKSGIHNTLEAAVYGKPVIFGPNYQKFKEAITLKEKGGGFSYNSDKELIEIVSNLINDSEYRKVTGAIAGTFVQESKGATGAILSWLRKNVF